MRGGTLPRACPPVHAGVVANPPRSVVYGGGPTLGHGRHPLNGGAREHEAQLRGLQAGAHRNAERAHRSRPRAAATSEAS